LQQQRISQSEHSSNGTPANQSAADNASTNQSIQTGNSNCIKTIFRLNKMETHTIRQLHQIAKGRGLSGYSKLRKADLIAALENFRGFINCIHARCTKMAWK